MNFHVVTLFPEMILQTVQNSVIGRAIRNGIISVDTVCIRDFSTNKHGRVDDYPYGGGAGMVMEAEPVYQAVSEAIRRSGSSSLPSSLPEAGSFDAAADVSSEKKPRVVYLTPQAEVLNQTKVEELAMEDDLILLCGHYEGIDERVLQEVVTDYISIGDYVLTGGELGALVLIDAVSRFVPGVLGNETSADFESMQDNLLEYPHYTRPEVWHGQSVPEILLSGDHRKVEAWRHEEAIRRTGERRPDLLKRALHVNCIWYGDEETGVIAGRLLDKISRYGSLLNYNRNALRRKKRQFTSRELLLVITDDPDPAHFPDKVYGEQTMMTVILVDREPEGMSCKPEGISCRTDGMSRKPDGLMQDPDLLSRGFIPAFGETISGEIDDMSLVKTALEIRKQYQ